MLNKKSIKRLEIMRFVREKSSAHPASHRENPGCLIEKKNQRHLNIQYSRISPRPRGPILDLFPTLFGPTEQYMFNFIYDKTNPQLWYATFQPCSTSSANKTDYFPVTTAVQESLGISQLMSYPASGRILTSHFGKLSERLI